MMYDGLNKSAAILSVAVYAFLLSSCTTTPAKTESNVQLRKSRIVERNLLVSKGLALPKYGRAGYDVSATLLATSKPQVVDMVEDNVIARDFIVFQNESSALATADADKALSTIKPLAGEDSLVLIVGNSHGPSAVGTGKLARRRADAVYNYFSQQGISKERMRRVASWGNVKVAHAPSRGVQVVVVKNSDPSKLLLTLAKR